RPAHVHRALHLRALLLDLPADRAALLGRASRSDVPGQQRRDPADRAGRRRPGHEDRAAFADGDRDGPLRRGDGGGVAARRDGQPDGGRTRRGSAMTVEATAAPTIGRPIPGPRGHPILGSIREIQRDNVQAFMDAWRAYGDIVHFRGPLTINLLVHPDYVEHVLRDNVANYPRPEFVTDKLKSIVGDGLVAAEGDRWANARRVSHPA